MEDLKKLLDTPKKVRTAVLCALVAAVTLGIVIGYSIRVLGGPGAGEAPPAASEAASAAPTQSPSSAPSEEPAQSQGLVGLVPALTIDQARELALADAGVTPEEAEVSREALGEDNGLMVYEFRFQTQDARYEYKLNANSGEVRAKVKEAFAAGTPAPSSAPAQSAAPRQSAAPEATRTPAATQAPAADVGVEGAKSAALADAGVSAAQATFTKAVLDYEDGRQVYDVEFHTATHEYEYEIVAATGAVYSRSAEAFQTAQPSAAPGGVYVGMDQAKSAALGHAGLTAAQVTFTHASMDREDGRVVYEIEFRQGSTEYEYVIDAATGRILEHETDSHH